MTVILDGKSLSKKIREGIKNQAAELVGAHPEAMPGLAVVLVGEDPASQIYVRSKGKACAEAGIASYEHRLPKETTQEDLLRLVDQLNKNDKVDGILVQMPLPSHISEDIIIEAIDPQKDVDGFHPINVGHLTSGKEAFVPCTPLGVMALLKEYEITTKGMEAVVVGRSNIVGRPMSTLLSLKEQGDATVTVCHSRTKDLAAHCRRADLIVAALGRPHFLTAEMVKEGAVVIDVGINRVEDSSCEKGYRVVGDVDYENVAPRCRAITPVPGGVGAMTIAMLLVNTLRAYRTRRGF